MSVIPNTKIRTSHSLAIRVRGVTIGKIQRWNVPQSRTVTAVFELNPDTTGEPVDNVPGNLGGLTLTVERFDLYASKMEEAFGGVDFNMLTDQNNPFDVVEVWKKPDGSTEQWIFEGCWFTSVGRDHSASGDRIVKATGTLQYIRKRRIQ